MARSTIDFSVLIVCDRYLQRLNLALRNWLWQDVDAATFEVLISSSWPNDGVRNYVQHIAETYSNHQVSLVLNGPGRTKLQYQETLIARARGRVLVLVDADVVFPTCFLSTVRDLDPQDGICIWLARAYLTRNQTYRAILGDLDLRDPDLFTRPLRGEVANAAVYEKTTTGYCHVYTRRTFEAANGYEGIEVWGGRYGGFASRLLRKMENMGVIKGYNKLENLVALHLWHGVDDGHENWNGTEILW